jgi:twitching motility protein PilI
MAATNTLRDYQASILARLEVAKQEGASASSGYLGMVVAGKNVLVNMQEISETLPITELYPVPLVKSWFLGVANVRGVLYAVNDVGQMIAGDKTVLSSNTRILLVSDDISSHVAILVERLLGIRKLDNMRKLPSDERVGFCMKPEAYKDDEGNVWQVLDCAKLVESKEFVHSYL